MSNLKYGFEVMNKDFAEITSDDKPQTYSHLSAVLQDLDVLLQDRMQKLSYENIAQVIRKLKDERDLSPEDIEQVEHWVIGDPAAFNQIESKFLVWQNELKRLIALINQHQKDEPDVSEIMTLRSMIKETLKVLAEIALFRQNQERVQNFQKSINKLNFDERDVLVRLLEKKIKSWDYR